MALEINRTEEPIADRDLYHNADKTKIVEDGSAEARFVLAGKGGPIPPEYRDQVAEYVQANPLEGDGAKQEDADEPSAEDKPKPDKKAVESAPSDKAVRAPSAAKAK